MRIHAAAANIQQQQQQLQQQQGYAAAKPPHRSTSQSLLAKLGQRFGGETSASGSNSGSGNSSSSAHEWSDRLRRRNPNKTSTTDVTPATTTTTTSGRKLPTTSSSSNQTKHSHAASHVATAADAAVALDDIESGVEITEDMSEHLLTARDNSAGGCANAAADDNNDRTGDADRTAIRSSSNETDIFQDVRDDDEGDHDNHATDAAAALWPQPLRRLIGSMIAWFAVALYRTRFVAQLCVRAAGEFASELRPKCYALAAWCVAPAAAWLCGVPAFLAGMLCCWCAMAGAQICGVAGRRVAGKWLQRWQRQRWQLERQLAGGPQRGDFAVPDYGQWPAIQVPADDGMYK